MLDILSADRQLASEIEFDLRRFDEQQAEEARKKEEAAAMAAAAAASAKIPKPATPDRVSGRGGSREGVRRAVCVILMSRSCYSRPYT